MLHKKTSEPRDQPNHGKVRAKMVRNSTAGP